MGALHAGAWASSVPPIGGRLNAVFGCGLGVAAG